MVKPALHEIEGYTFCIGTDGGASELRPKLNIADTLPLCSLDALVKMEKTEGAKKYTGPCYVMIPDHMSVRCFSQPVEELRNLRQMVYEVSATDVPRWEAEAQLGFEVAQIAMRTRFQEMPDTTYAGKHMHESFYPRSATARRLRSACYKRCHSESRVLAKQRANPSPSLP